MISTVLLLLFLIGNQLLNSNTSEVNQAAVASNAFAFQLYKELSEVSGNLFFSPFGAHVALTMVYSGAADDTAREMATVLHLFGTDIARVQKSYRQLNTGLQNSIGDRGFHVANKLYCDSSMSLRPEYKRLVLENFFSEAEEVDFQYKSEFARIKINKWVEDETKIKDIVQKGNVGSSTRSVLVNALYFTREWAVAFNPLSTVLSTFMTSKMGEKEVQMMHVDGPGFGFEEYSYFKVLSMDYKGGNISMLVLLPNEIEGIVLLEDALPNLNWNDIDERTKQHVRVNVTFPKFKMESQIKLTKHLKKMGIYQAFFRGLANFSGVTGTKLLYISQIIQKSYIEFVENGITSYSGQDVLGSKIHRRYEDQQLRIFRADRPFIFLIRHKPSNLIIFMGRYSGPQGNIAT